TPPRAAPQPTLAPGGWGENYGEPVAMDDGTLAALRAEFGTLTAKIVVDADGHANAVALPASLSDAARAEIVRRLEALRYVPAECNGLRCTGTLVLAI
ncbi:MAG: hypothetical protein ACREM2_07550, partial [Vulcanimicrobiaceae bacterium]